MARSTEASHRRRGATGWDFPLHGTVDFELFLHEDTE